jgi:hypothetical protein
MALATVKATLLIHGTEQMGLPPSFSLARRAAVALSRPMFHRGARFYHQSIASGEAARRVR